MSKSLTHWREAPAPTHEPPAPCPAGAHHWLIERPIPGVGQPARCKRCDMRHTFPTASAGASWGTPGIEALRWDSLHAQDAPLGRRKPSMADGGWNE